MSLAEMFYIDWPTFFDQLSGLTSNALYLVKSALLRRFGLLFCEHPRRLTSVLKESMELAGEF